MYPAAGVVAGPGCSSRSAAAAARSFPVRAEATRHQPSSGGRALTQDLGAVAERLPWAGVVLEAAVVCRLFYRGRRMAPATDQGLQSASEIAN